MSTPRQTYDPVPPLPRNPWSRRRPDEWPLDEEGPEARSFDAEWGTIPLVLNPDGSDPVRTGPPPGTPHLAASLSWAISTPETELAHVLNWIREPLSSSTVACWAARPQNSESSMRPSLRSCSP